MLKELKLRKDTGMGLLGKTELYKVLDVILQFSSARALLVEFTYNVDLGSLSIYIIQNEETVYWFLFQDEKLNKLKLKQLKKDIHVKFPTKSLKYCKYEGESREVKLLSVYRTYAGITVDIKDESSKSSEIVFETQEEMLDCLGSLQKKGILHEYELNVSNEFWAVVINYLSSYTH